jgi:dihydroxyacetone kinase-like predicted kinase
VHVHVNDPGVVLSEALGTIGDVEIDDMHAQPRERSERLTTPDPEVERWPVVVTVGPAAATITVPRARLPRDRRRGNP